MTEREQDAIDLLRRFYEGDLGKPLNDSDEVCDWLDNEIGAFISKHGTFKELLPDD